MSAIRPRRSVLYMPGANERALEKAKTLPADSLILDLEDAVAPEAKVEARDRVCSLVRAGGYGPRELIIRINGQDTEWGKADVKAAAHAHPDGILAPKVTSGDDIRWLDEAISEAGAPRALQLWVMIETPLAILNIKEIAAAAKTTRLAGFVMGSNDLIKDFRAEPMPGRENLAACYTLAIAAARAYDLLVFDGVYNDIANAEGFAAEARQARAFGFDGKTLIHPSQVEPCNTIFAPAADAVAQARDVIAAFADPANSGKGVLKVNGKMTELLHLAQARRTVAVAEAIAQRGRPMTLKSDPGNFFEDFVVGDELVHATPRTITEADAAIYTGLTGSRYALYSADTFAQDIGLEGAPIDPLLAFHIVFGKTVPDISLNAVANLGYADGRFLAPVYPGDTLRAVSEVIGVKENSNGKTGVVYVRTHGYNQQDTEVLNYVRWVMVNKKDDSKPAPAAVIPELPKAVDPRDLPPRAYALEDYDFTLAGSPFGFEDYEIGEKIDHVDAFTVEEAEHQIATRLYQNTAKVHFNQYAQRQTPRGKRLIYGGVAISLARSIAFNGLANAAEIIAINAGSHVNPLTAGDTVFAWSEVLDKADLGDGLGALRLRLVATRNLPCAEFPYKDAEGKYLTEVILDFDYWAAIPKRG